MSWNNCPNGSLDTHVRGRARDVNPILPQEDQAQEERDQCLTARGTIKCIITLEKVL